MVALAPHYTASLRWTDGGCSGGTKQADWWDNRRVCRQASTSYANLSSSSSGGSSSSSSSRGHGGRSSGSSSRLRVSPPGALPTGSISSISSSISSISSTLAPPPPQQQPRLQDTDPSTLLLNQRMIFLGSQVDDFSADVIISQMLLLDAQDPTQDIKLLINSPGGSVTAGMGIYDAMKLCKADVSTICFGLAASMGAFLLSAGTKGKRYCMPNARVMIHQPLGGAGGTAIDVGLQVREMMYHKVKLTKIMARLTGKTEKQIEEDTDRDNFMNAWEAKEYGLVDHVVDDGKPGLVAPVGEIKEPPKSQVWSYWRVKDRKERKTLPSEAPPAAGGKEEQQPVRKEEETTTTAV